jgi:multidrug efflux pump subunit AcrB
LPRRKYQGNQSGRFFGNDNWLFGEEFTVMSMISVILLSVIFVRYAMLLVESVMQGAAVGMDIEQAVIQACKVRARPIIITTIAVIVGAAVLLTDDVFRGVAVSMICGSLVATVLTFLVVPMNCVSAQKSLLSAVGRLHMAQEG